MDGICDAIGTVFFLVASWILLRKKLHRKGLNSNNNIHMLYSSPADEEPLLLESGQAVTPMKLHHSSGGVSSSSSSSSGGGGSPLSSKPAVHLNLATVTILCLLMQEFFGSFFWNRYMVNYHDLLELPVSTSIEAYQVG